MSFKKKKLIQWDSWEVIKNYGCNLWADEFLRMNTTLFCNKPTQGLINVVSSEIQAEAGPSYIRDIARLEWMNFEGPSSSKILCSVMA